MYAEAHRSRPSLFISAAVAVDVRDVAGVGASARECRSRKRPEQTRVVPRRSHRQRRIVQASLLRVFLSLSFVLSFCPSLFPSFLLSPCHTFSRSLLLSGENYLGATTARPPHARRACQCSSRRCRYLRLTSERKEIRLPGRRRIARPATHGRRAMGRRRTRLGNEAASPGCRTKEACLSPRLIFIGVERVRNESKILCKLKLPEKPRICVCVVCARVCTHICDDTI